MVTLRSHALGARALAAVGRGSARHGRRDTSSTPATRRAYVHNAFTSMDLEATLDDAIPLATMRSRNPVGSVARCARPLRATRFGASAGAHCAGHASTRMASPVPHAAARGPRSPERLARPRGASVPFLTGLVRYTAGRRPAQAVIFQAGWPFLDGVASTWHRRVLRRRAAAANRGRSGRQATPRSGRRPTAAASRRSAAYRRRCAHSFAHLALGSRGSRARSACKDRGAGTPFSWRPRAAWPKARSAIDHRSPCTSAGCSSATTPRRHHLLACARGRHTRLECRRARRSISLRLEPRPRATLEGRLRGCEALPLRAGEELAMDRPYLFVGSGTLRVLARQGPTISRMGPARPGDRASNETEAWYGFARPAAAGSVITRAPTMMGACIPRIVPRRSHSDRNDSQGTFNRQDRPPSTGRQRADPGAGQTGTPQMHPRGLVSQPAILRQIIWSKARLARARSRAISQPGCTATPSERGAARAGTTVGSPTGWMTATPSPARPPARRHAERGLSATRHESEGGDRLWRTMTRSTAASPPKCSLARSDCATAAAKFVVIRGREMPRRVGGEWLSWSVPERCAAPLAPAHRSSTGRRRGRPQKRRQPSFRDQSLADPRRATAR